MELFHFGEQCERDRASGGEGARWRGVRCVSFCFVCRCDLLLVFVFYHPPPPPLHSTHSSLRNGSDIFLYFFFAVQITRNVPRFICCSISISLSLSLSAQCLLSSVFSVSKVATAQIKVEAKGALRYTRRKCVYIGKIRRKIINLKYMSLSYKL